nr:uncharacterized protein LOC104096205 isoform X3 [Nicotiana tomentosiformis]
MARKRQRNSSQKMLLPDFSEQQEQMEVRQCLNHLKTGHKMKDKLSDLNNLSDLGGPTMMHSGWGKDGGILHVEFNNLSQAIGPDAARLSSKLGVIARNDILAPLNHKDWRLVPKLYKNRILAYIKENTDATEDMRRMLMISVGSKWK